MRQILLATFALLLFSFSNAQDWQPVSSLPGNFQAHHSFGFGLGDYGYLVTGNTSSGSFARSFFKYDPSSDTWTQLIDHPGPGRGFGIGEVYEGKAYMGFGADNFGNYLKDLWVFDPETETWTQLPDCTCDARIHPTFTIADGHIYVGLGGNDDGNLKDWWEYDIAEETWTQRTDFPGRARHHPYQFSIDGYVYTGLGHGNGFISNEWYRYDPANDTWMQMASLPAEGRVAGQQFAFQGKGYVLSGEGEDHRAMEEGEWWEYDPILDTWTAMPVHPGTSRWAPSSFIVNGEVYLVNGMVRAPGQSVFYETDNFKYQLADVVNQKNIPTADDNWVVYPNPSHGLIAISNENTGIASKPISAHLIDQNGRKVRSWNDVSGNSQLDISMVSAGVYTLLIQQEQGLVRKKVIRQ